LAPPHQASGETILIVEDEHAVRHMLRRTLEEAGYRVLESESADAALIVVQTPGIEVHLVLTDVVMPA
jgi:CheY-like chemotaxis protein